ncbi:hypothetical protein F511_44530 [Dorcoceras hygrometricum]|uniref:Uncharacterized protein n=1 Tax=Dorcoceras hygrometricum TaxID=472368 RepID=A0A2Z6ZYA6_9LAMI|nr:hypothetical protein F511_44530 [Dorcoceras hygrometricum]
MTKRGKVAAVARSPHLMIETEVVLVGLMEETEEEEVIIKEAIFQQWWWTSEEEC